MRALALVLALALPAAAGAAEVVLTPDMLRPHGSGAFRVTGLTLPDLSAAPLVDPRRDDAAAGLLRRVAATTSANGHRGILYDNRDRGHSALPERAFPGLARLTYGAGLDGADFGLALRFRYPAVVLGNSSTALTHGPRARSLTRLAMTEPGYPRLAFALAASNHLYVYPEHRDHDTIDRYPANWPIMVTSQGSSGSDRPFLDAFALTLAAFSEATMETMRAEGLVVPTLQMILRRNISGIDRAESYFTGAAHPTVVDAAALRPARMVAHAAALTPETLPPMVRLAVVEEDFSATAGLDNRSERLFTLPTAVARLWRGPEGRKSMRLSAAGTMARSERPLAFRWVLLRGDPAKVTLTPAPDGASAEITLDWHDAFEVASPGGPLTTSRVDIGVFEVSGPEPSAPATLSVSFPTHERRTWRQGPEGAPELASVDYDAAGRGAYFDPVLWWSAPWADEPLRDGEGEITGWKRTGGGTVRVVPEGPEAPRYTTRPDHAGRPILGIETR